MESADIRGTYRNDQEYEKLRAELAMVKADNVNMRKEFDMELESYKKIITEMEMQRMQLESEGHTEQKVENLVRILQDTERKLARAELDLRHSKDQMKANEVYYNKKINAIENELKEFRNNTTNSLKKDYSILHDNTDTINSSLNEMLSLGKEYMDSLKTLSPEYLTLKEKLYYLNKLFKKVISENDEIARKYNKLLDLHNLLVEVSNEEEMFNPNKMNEVAEENTRVKQQLEFIHQRYE